MWGLGISWWEGLWTSIAWLPKVSGTDKSVVLHETIPGGRKGESISTDHLC